MRKALLLASLLAASPALAAQVPAADKNDPRVRHAVFNGDVVEVHAAELHSLSLQLCPGDTVTQTEPDVAAGLLSVPDPSTKGPDGKGVGKHIFWAVLPLGNVVTIKPDDMVPTNVQLIAMKQGGGIRIYQLDLIPHRSPTEPVDPAQPNGPQKAVAWYSIDFRCPDDEKAAAIARWRARRDEARAEADRQKEQAARDRLSTDFLDGKRRNWGYSVQTGTAK